MGFNSCLFPFFESTRQLFCWHVNAHLFPWIGPRCDAPLQAGALLHYQLTADATPAEWGFETQVSAMELIFVFSSSISDWCCCCCCLLRSDRLHAGSRVSALLPAGGIRCLSFPLRQPRFALKWSSPDARERVRALVRTRKWSIHSRNKKKE